MTIKKLWLLSTGATLTMLLVAQSAFAVAFTTPADWTRGDPNSTYQHWDAFSASFGATPDVANSNPNGTATAGVTPPGLLTSSSNYYSFGGPFSVLLDVPDYNLASHRTLVMLQVATEGNELLPGTLFANAVAPHYSEELFRGTVTSPFGPVERVETLFLFGIETAANFSLQLGANIHASVVEVAVDTFASPIPEPTTALMVMVGLAGLGVSGRRMRQS
jgi:hypothetical protein